MDVETERNGHTMTWILTAEAAAPGIHLHRSDANGDLRSLRRETQLPLVLWMTVEAKRFEKQYVGQMAGVCTNQTETLDDPPVVHESVDSRLQELNHKKL